MTYGCVHCGRPMPTAKGKSRGLCQSHYNNPDIRSRYPAGTLASSIGPPSFPEGTSVPTVGEGATVLDTQVTRPVYYGGAADPYEVIKVLEAWLTSEEFVGWLKGTIIKYMPRAGRKGQKADDLAKAAWYSRYLSEYQKRTAK